MPFDPTIPAHNDEIESAELRAQFNALNDRDNTLAADIAAIPAGPPGPQGIQGNDGPQGIQGIQGNDGAVGPQGPVGDFTLPITQNALFDAPVYMGSQELKFDTTRDIGGSSEALAGISAIDAGSGPLLVIRCRGGGLDKSTVRLDPTGIQDGAGNPTVQDGDILQYRSIDQTIHPAPKAALNPSSVIPLGLIVSDPPTQAELQAVANKLDELIAALIRP